MPAFIRIHSRLFLSIITLLAIVLPAAVVLFITHWLGMQRIEESVGRMAHQTLARADTIGIEMRQSRDMLAMLDGRDPCSQGSILLMRKALLHGDALADVGYIHGDRLLCSALGHHDLFVGLPTYTSDAGFEIRNEVHLPDAPEIGLLTATDPKTGFSMFAHARQVMDGIPANEPWDMAIVGTGPQGAVLAARGRYDPDWMQRTSARRSGMFIDEDHIVAWERSKVGAYMAFAAMPGAMWRPIQRMGVRLGLLLGLPVSLLLLVVLRRMNSRNTTIRYLLREALKHDELSLAYHPVVELATGRWIGAEALMRWNRPRGETISPDIFIPIAEKSGLMPALGEQLLRIFERETPLLFSRHPDFHVALNFCAADLCAAGLPSRLQAAIDRVGAEPRNLHVEVTERVFMHLEQARPSIEELQKRGVSVAIDDFGTGFSSLSYLTRLKFDYLKIDKTFVSAIQTEAVTSKIVDHVIAMSQSLGIAMIAEGVETRAQADYLREQGVHYAQGWLYARAMPIQELLERLAAGSQPDPGD